MGCNASNHPPNNNNPNNVRSTSYSIFRRCRRRKKNKEEQNDEYNDEELKRKIDMMSGVSSGAGADDANKDISFSHHGFNFLGNSFSKSYFKGGTGGNNGSGEFYEDGEQDDLNNKNSRSGAGNGSGGGSGIFVNVPLLAQSQASSSQLDFFRMLDQKIQEGPDYQTPSTSCCSSDIELDEGDSGTWTKMRKSSCSSKSCTKNHNHNHYHHHHHYQLLHHEAKTRWKTSLFSSASCDKPPPGYNAVNCIIETNRSSATSGGASSLIASGTTPSSSPLVGGACGGGITNRTNIIAEGGVGVGAGGHVAGRNSNNNHGNATIITNNSALKDFYLNDRGLRSSPHLPHRDSQC